MAFKRSDGKWVERFTFDGKRITVYGKTKKEAMQKAILREEELKGNKYKKGTELTLDEYHERWEKSRFGAVSEATIRTQSIEYRKVSKTVIDNAGTLFGSLKIVDIEVQNVRDLQSALLSEKKKDGSAKYTTRAINDIMNHIKHIMNDAMKERIITWNPFCSVSNLKRTEKEARYTIHRALTNEETKLFFDNAVESWYYDVFRFMLYSGCRCGEVGAIKLSDIDSKKGVINIKRTITRICTGEYIIGKSTKTKHGEREIPLTDELKGIIEHQRKMNAIRSANTLRFDELIFTSPEGSLLNVPCVDREIQRICKRVGIERFTAHGFRDTFATRCIESGMNPKTLQEILGHADIGITMNLYCHVMDETKSNEMKMVKIII